MRDCLFTENDLACIERYREFIPKRVFDAHMHLYCSGSVPSFYGMNDAFLQDSITPDTYRSDMQKILHGAEIRLNMIPMPDPILSENDSGMRKKVNQYVSSFSQNGRGDCASLYVLPTQTEEQIAKEVDELGVRALKCYCYAAKKANVEALAVGEFLPEAAWYVANEKSLPIILHLMRPAALSDADNFSYITAHAAKYPNAKLILAHCARGFASWTAVSKIRALEDCENVWFDLAAICEPAPIMAAILENAGKKTMWGSDYPICMHRGRAVSIGNSQDWLMGQNYSGPERTYIAIENLNAFYQAALLLQLDQKQIDSIFYDNASRCFGG